jgi:hypothetical protein
VPFMWFSAAIFAVGCGLLYSLKVNSGHGMWIGYQTLAGAGAGAGVQIPFIAVQVVLQDRDLPAGNAVVIFFQSLGGAISVSIAQSVFSNTLRKQIPLLTTGVDVEKVINAGATHLREVVTSSQLPGCLEAYSKAVSNAFVLPIVMAGLALIASFFMEMKSVKGKKLGAPVG